MAVALLGFTLNTATLGEMTEAFSVTVGGSSRPIDTERVTIVDRLSASGSASLYVRGAAPAELSEVRIYNGGTGGICLFGGHAIRTSYDSIVRLGDDPWWQLDCQDYTWLLNRYRRVRGTYTGCGVNTTLRRILAEFSDGGFRVGYCPQSLGDVRDLVLDDVSMTDALDRLAESCDAFWDVDPDKRVHIFQDPDHLSTDSVALSAALKNFSSPSYTRDGVQMATRVVCHGASRAVAALTAAGSTTLVLDDVAPFAGAASSAGDAFVSGIAFSYTGVDVVAKTLTGVTGLTGDAVEGAQVFVRAVVDDATAQSDLSTLLGGASGVAELLIGGEGLSRDEAVAAATAILERRKATFTSLSYDTYDQQHTHAQNTVPGQMVSVSLTSPLTVSASLRVQEIKLSTRVGMTLSGASLQFNRRVTLAPYFRGLALVGRLTRS